LFVCEIPLYCAYVNGLKQWYSKMLFSKQQMLSLPEWNLFSKAVGICETWR